MQYKQHNDGSADITFTWKERWRILTRGKIHLSADAFKHSCNNMFNLLFPSHDPQLIGFLISLSMII